MTFFDRTSRANKCSTQQHALHACWRDGLGVGEWKLHALASGDRNSTRVQGATRTVRASEFMAVNFNIILTTCKRRCEKMVDILFHLRHGVKSKEVQGA